MATYATMLRAVNVGGRVMAMAKLREVYESLGFEQIQTYIQSGNVVFRTTRRATGLAQSIEDAIAREFGAPVTVLVRSARDLARTLEANPFIDRKVDTKALHVTFLRDAPSAQKVAGIDRSRFEPDAFEVVGREVYGYYPRGYGRSKMHNAFFERALGTPATTRNWNTVRKLHEMTG
jgi:uncharacterized protein (DUF1697 family)